MNNKLFFGMALIIMGVFSLIGSYLPQNLFIYFFNWQVLLILIGIYLILKKGVNNMAGIWLIGIGVYFYLHEFLPIPYTNIALPIVLIIVGIALLVLYFKDRNK